MVAGFFLGVLACGILLFVLILGIAMGARSS
jgi:hypothetical protein